MPMTDETDDSGGVILDGPFDPDAQATVTDYIDYTEYLPADLIRSLTLIRGLDDRYLDSAQAVHQLTQTYGQLPDLPAETRPGPIALRKDISFQINRAINARESAYAEACRLYDVVDRHFDRLGCIRQKLEALPKPAEEEPSPPLEPVSKRARGGKKSNKDATTRITLRLDNRNRRDNHKKRHTGVDGTFDPDSPLASTEQSDMEGEIIKAAPKPARPPKKEKARRLSSGTGQSTAQALAQLKPPPADAKLGSEDLPWLRLTEWEMTRLRKKMKKNAVWQPSEVMIHRELALANRGWEAYRAAKALAEETGGEFIDCDNIEETRRGEAAKDLEETKLSNRGMKLNEAKKLKREQLAREQALMEGEGALIKPLPNPAQPNPVANRSSRKRKREEIALQETESVVPEPPRPAHISAPVPPPTPAPGPSSRAGASRRRSSRGAVPAAETTSDIVPPIKTRMSPGIEAKLSPPLPSPTGSRRSNRSLVQTVTTPTPPITRPSSGRSAAAASIEGGAGTLNNIPTAIAASGRDHRIKSATPGHKLPIREASNAPSVPGPARRRKRPAPGPISNGQDGGAAVSYGRRKAKPGKKRLNIRDSQDVRVDEDGVLEQIDANEPRYCLCGDVSFGTMICCENQDVSYTSL